MADVSVSSLNPEAQQQVEKLRAAVAQGAWGFAGDLGGDLLAQWPACAEVRRLVHRAHEGRGPAWGGPALARLLGWGGAPFWRMLLPHPAQRRRLAEVVLARDPDAVVGFWLLATAARELGWPETARWAWQELHRRQPDEAAVACGLTDACLALGHLEEALGVAEAAARRWPHDPAVLALLRQAAAGRTLHEGRWHTDGSFREKLRRE